MKHSHIILAGFLSIALIACNNSSAPSDENSSETAQESTESKTVDISDMETIDLSEFDLNAKMKVANESNGKREISFTDAGNIQITAGKRYGIEIVPFGMSIAEKKEELAGDLVYEIEYLEETENSMIYAKTIKDSEIEAEYHFFYAADLDGEIIEIKNIDGVSFKQGMIEKMLASAKSLQSN